MVTYPSHSPTWRSFVRTNKRKKQTPKRCSLKLHQEGDRSSHGRCNGREDAEQGALGVAGILQPAGVAAMEALCSDWSLYVFLYLYQVRPCMLTSSFVAV